jgi:hypothetical protein
VVGRSLAELAEVDPTTARFSPAGLLTEHRMKPEASAEYVQAMIADARLATEVPGDIRTAFERLRDLHTYGLFVYGFFTIADAAAWMFIETAVGARFVDWYSNRVPLIRGTERTALEAPAFRSVAEALGPRGSHPWRAGWRLEGHAKHEGGRFFDASYASLMRWARREGLLHRWLETRWDAHAESIQNAVLTRVRPPDYSIPDDWSAFDDREKAEWWSEWRDRVWERDQIDTLVALRNLSAHAMPGHTIMPVNSASTLRTVAGFVDALWEITDDST